MPKVMYHACDGLSFDSLEQAELHETVIKLAASIETIIRDEQEIVQHIDSVNALREITMALAEGDTGKKLLELYITECVFTPDVTFAVMNEFVKNLGYELK